MGGRTAGEREAVGEEGGCELLQAGKAGGGAWRHALAGASRNPTGRAHASGRVQIMRFKFSI